MTTPLLVTTFPDVTARRAKSGETTWPEFVCWLEQRPRQATKHGALVKLAEFGDHRTKDGSLRSDRNVRRVHGIEADYDGGEVSPEEARARLERHHIRAVVVTTWSHTPERPRWRVFAPLSKPTDPDQHRRLVAALNGALGGILNSESFRLSQSYFVGGRPDGEYRVLVTFDDPEDGYPIDQWERLEEFAYEPSQNGATAPVGETRLPPERLREIRSALAFIGNVDDRDQWFRIGMMLHSTGANGQAYGLWSEWSQQSDKYDAADQRRVWESFTPGGGLTVASLFAEAYASGWQAPVQPPKTDPPDTVSEDFAPEPEPSPEAEQPPEETFPLLRDLLERPELLEPPEPVIPRIAYHGRGTLLVAPDKAGKSTLLAHATAAVSRGALFLGEPTEAGSVLWCGIEEAVSDAVRRFHEIDAHPDRVRILALQPPNLYERLRAQLVAWPANLMVVDSLAEYARVTRGSAPEDGDNAGWGSVVRPLVDLGRHFGCAVVLLHHPRRSDGQYRGSGEIAAAVDCLWEMLPPQPGEEPTLRRFRGRARWPVQSWTLRMIDGRYVLGGGGALTLDAQILADTGQHPGTSRTAQHERLGGRKKTYLAAVRELVEKGHLQDFEGKLFLPSDVPGDLL